MNFAILWSHLFNFKGESAGRFLSATARTVYD